MSKATDTERAAPKVGDRVRLQYGRDRVEGIVVEDRGRIGVGGAQLLRVRIPRRDADDVEIELPVEKLEAC